VFRFTENDAAARNNAATFEIDPTRPRTMENPSRYGEIVENIPPELRAIPRFLRWSVWADHDGKPTKRPECSPADRTHWQRFEDCLNLTSAPTGGLGLAFSGGVEVDGARLIALDLDSCVAEVNGELVVAPWARQVVTRCGSYTEISPGRNGLHVFVLVEDPTGLPNLIRVDADPVEPTKKPQLQVFGLGSTQYMTVTGWSSRMPAPMRRLNRVSNLAWLAGQPWARAVQTYREDTPHVEIEGPAPSANAVERALRADPTLAALIDGDWSSAGYDTASEGWAKLVGSVLGMMRQQIAPTVDFLLHRTEYGSGNVDSREPGRYTREEWVSRDVERLAGKRAASTAANSPFEPVQFFGAADNGAAQPSTTPAAVPMLVDPVELRRIRREQRFLFWNFLPAVGLAQVFGAPASGKTPFALSMAVHVALGRDWFGHASERSGTVVYVVGEDLHGISMRAEAQCAALGVDDRMLPLLFSTRPAALTKPAERKVWRDAIREKVTGSGLPPVALVVVDTLATNFGPADENSTEDMVAFVSTAQGLSADLDACVMLVHHTGRQFLRARGSSALDGALDANFSVERVGNSMQVVLTPTKFKNWPEPDPVYAMLKAHTLGEDAKGRPVTAVTLAECPFVDETEDASPVELGHPLDSLILLAVFDDGNALLDDAPMSTKDIVAKVEGGRRTVLRRIAWLEETGALEARGVTSDRSYRLTTAGFLTVSRLSQ
jgi:hypothetical protein